MVVLVCLPILVGSVRRFSFRKYAFLSFAIVGLFLLCGLGFWQIERLHWKEDLIQNIQDASLQAPLKEKQLSSCKPRDILFKRVFLKGTLLSHVFYIIGRTYNKQSGYHALVPLRIKKDRVLLINIGWVPTKNIIIPKGINVSVMGYVRVPESYWFTPKHTPAQNEWGFVDIEKMKRVVGQDLLPVYISARNIHPSILGVKAHVALPKLRNKHLSYAITWFVLAFCWLVFAGYFYRKNWLRG